MAIFEINDQATIDPRVERKAVVTSVEAHKVQSSHEGDFVDFVDSEGKLIFRIATSAVTTIRRVSEQPPKQ